MVAQGRPMPCQLCPQPLLHGAAPGVPTWDQPLVLLWLGMTQLGGVGGRGDACPAVWVMAVPLRGFNMARGSIRRLWDPSFFLMT